MAQNAFYALSFLSYKKTQGERFLHYMFYLVDTNIKKCYTIVVKKRRDTKWKKQNSMKL